MLKRHMFKKLLFFLSFFFISAIPAFAACTISTSPSSLPAGVDTPVQVTVNETGTVTQNYLFTNLRLASLIGNLITNTGSTPSWCTGTYSLLHPDVLECDNVNSTGNTYVWNIHMNLRDNQEL